MGTIRPSRLDHVALWVADRDTLADFLCGHLGMHVIERTDDFTLVGADARLGKLTLFAAEGPREPGALRRVVLRVADLEGAVAALPEDLPLERSGEEVRFEGPEQLGLGLTRGDATTDYDIDHVTLAVPDPERTGRELGELGFNRRDGRLWVADKHIRLEPGPGEDRSGRPLLNHLALLVDSAEALRREADRRGVPVARVVDAPNTFAVFLHGPAGIELEYVEHKPGFALT